MSMYTFVTGIKPPDEKWKKLKEVWEVCEKGGVRIPEEVLQFFKHEPPDMLGVVVNLKEDMCVEHRHGNASEIWEVDITKLPKDVKIIRFENSY